MKILFCRSGEQGKELNMKSEGATGEPGPEEAAVLPRPSATPPPRPHEAPAMCPTVTIISEGAHSLSVELSHRHENASRSVSQSMAQGWQLVCKQPTLTHKEIRSLHPNGNPGCYRARCFSLADTFHGKKFSMKEGSTFIYFWGASSFLIMIQ